MESDRAVHFTGFIAVNEIGGLEHSRHIYSTTNSAFCHPYRGLIPFMPAHHH